MCSEATLSSSPIHLIRFCLMQGGPMYRTVSRIGLAIILIYAIATAAQVVVPQQSPSPAGIPSGLPSPQPTASPAGLPNEGLGKKPDADAAPSTSGPESSKPEL